VTAPVASATSINSSGANDPRARRGGKKRKVEWKAYLYILPAFVLFAVFLGVPAVQTAQYSLFKWNGIGPSTWVGLQNYAELFTDSVLRSSFLHAGVLIFFYAVIPLVLALFLTAIISRGANLRGMSVFRTLLFLPQVVASVVVATIWVAIYSPDGLINQLLRLVGLGSLTRAWLGDFDTALPAVGIIGSWLGIGLCLVLFLSGVANIQPELFEAARIDGAGPVGEFFSITLPALRGQIAGGLDANRGGGVEDVRPGLHHDPRRSRHEHHAAGVRGVQPGLQHRQGRFGGGRRDRADSAHPGCHGADPEDPTGRGRMKANLRGARGVSLRE
jgi:raffinose/stachyose/melibiose transport system permease protein